MRENLFMCLSSRLMFQALKTFLLLLWYFLPMILWDEGLCPEESTHKSDMLLSLLLSEVCYVLVLYI